MAIFTAFALCFLALGTVPDAYAKDPLFAFTPRAGAASPPQQPPPTGYLNGACGAVVDGAGRFYLADPYHDRVDVYSSSANYQSPTATGSTGYLTQIPAADLPARPCYLTVASDGALYVAGFHGAVHSFSPYPDLVPQGIVDTGPVTGIAVDPANDRLYLNRRDRITAYDAAGDPVMNGLKALSIGAGSLTDSYALAVSEAPATQGHLYVTDNADLSLKVFDPAGPSPDIPIQVIDGSDTPREAFTSLRDVSVAVDADGGEVYLEDNLQPLDTEQPEAIVWAFAADGGYLGHLKHRIVSGSPSGLAVDNSGGVNQGRVYVTSGNSHEAGIYAYPPDPATLASPEAPQIPPDLLSGEDPFATIPVGGPAGQGDGILCEGDSCQRLPPDPESPTLTTLLKGLGNPPVRYVRAPTNCRPHLRTFRKLTRRSRKARTLVRHSTGTDARTGTVKLRRQARSLRDRASKQRRAFRVCVVANRRGERRGAGKASASNALGPARPNRTQLGVAHPGSIDIASGLASRAGTQARSANGGWPSSTSTGGLEPPTSEGFSARAIADGGGEISMAGSRPYRLSLSLAPEGGGVLSNVRFDLPEGLLVNPSTVRACPDEDFAEPRRSALGSGYESGESCPARSQVGTVSVKSSLGDRSFGLFMLSPREGSAFRLGASPFGHRVIFEAGILAGDPGGRGTVLDAAQIPAALGLEALSLSVWGVPFDASHNTLRGSCLNEQEPSFAFGKCSVGEPTEVRPLAFLTLPTVCERASTYRAVYETAAGRGAATNARPALTDCDSLEFASRDMKAEGVLSTKNASTPAGFVFRLRNEDPNLARPRSRIRSEIRRARVKLPDGVTLNPALGSGLSTCSNEALARESAFNSAGAGCPNGSKIGGFRVRLPYFTDFLEGGVYLAEPNDPESAGSENPFDALVGVYLIAKSKERGILIKAPGVLVPDSADGTLTATFDRLPQLPYTDLEVSFRAGQRSALISPPVCGGAATRITLSPWAAGAGEAEFASATEIRAGIGAGACPTGDKPFTPDVRAGGVNSNIGSYTPYFIGISRRDSEQQITNYSLSLPRGITAKLAGIPFCPEAAIDRARKRSGKAELRDPSCPEASLIGRTVSGYGVGAAPAYATGRVYLAGPTDGRPLSLVTINSAVVGPFDLGTIVIRSAFSLDRRSAKLEIDSSASDPIPHILRGVPLHLKEIRIWIDREEFTRNPTSCEAAELVSRLEGSGSRLGDPSDDTVAVSREHFQLLNCLELGFRPRLGLRLRGGVRRSAHPSLRATFRSRGGRDANLKDITVTMPRSLFLAQDHIRGICTRPQFARDSCPADSVYGYARAETPLFDVPLSGPVHLRSSGNPLPDLVASLSSGSIRIVLEGRIGPSRSGGIRVSFGDLPDAPITRFALHLLGGKRGLLVNSENICESPPRANVRALGQNNRGAVFSTTLRGRCGRWLKRRKAHERAEKVKEKRRAKQRVKRRAKRPRPSVKGARAGASAEMSVAGGSAATTVRRGPVVATVSGKLSPIRLPQVGKAPVAARMGGEIAMADGSLPPKLRMLRIEINRQGRIDARGLPVCRVANIQPGTSEQALKGCGPSLVGKGSFSAQIALQGQPPYATRGELLVFHSRKGKRPILLGHIFTEKPFFNSFAIEFSIRRIDRGPFGTELVARLPPSLASWGHITGIEMRLTRTYRFRGRQRSYLTAGCPAPPGFRQVLFPFTRTTFAFDGGTRLRSTLRGRCIPR